MKPNDHQIKTQWYYWFWAVCAVAVVGGQVYVGSGYRHMAQELMNTFQTSCDPRTGPKLMPVSPK